MRVLLALVSFFVCISSFAQEVNEVPNFNYMGYVYQGLNKSDYNNYGGQSSAAYGSTDVRDIGVLASYQVNHYVDVRGFLKWQQSGERMVQEMPQFNYLLIDIHDVNGLNSTYGIRLGKVRNELGFYNATMENPASRDMDILPQGVYRTTLEQFINSGTGFQAYYHTENAPWLNLTFEYANTTPQFTPAKDVGSAWFTTVPVGTLSSNLPAESFHLLATTKDLRWMVRYDQFNVNTQFKASTGDFVPSGDYSVRVSLLGIRRYFDTWDITYEVLKDEQVGGSWELIRPNGQYSLAQNIVLRKNFTDKWTAYIGYNEWLSDHTDASGVRGSAASGGFVPTSDFYNKDWNIGFVYRPARSWIVRGSYHQIEGIVSLSPIDNPKMLQTAKDKDNLYTLSVTYTF